MTFIKLDMLLITPSLDVDVVTENSKSDSILWKFIVEAIRCLWSPQQIAKRLKTFPDLDQTMNVSHTTIYSTIRALPKGELKKTYYPVYVMKIKSEKLTVNLKKILYYRILKLFMSAQPKFKKEKYRVIGKLI